MKILKTTDLKKKKRNIRKSFNNCYYFYYVTLFLFKIHTHRTTTRNTSSAFSIKFEEEVQETRKNYVIDICNVK